MRVVEPQDRSLNHAAGKAGRGAGAICVLTAVTWGHGSCLFLWDDLPVCAT